MNVMIDKNEKAFRMIIIFANKDNGKKRKLKHCSEFATENYEKRLQFRHNKHVPHLQLTQKLTIKVSDIFVLYSLYFDKLFKVIGNSIFETIGSNST